MTEKAMIEKEIKFCLQCGAEVVVNEVTPNHIVELYCPHCGSNAEVLLKPRILIGTNAAHDPDSDFEPW